jgi:hypothetical protein
MKPPPYAREVAEHRAAGRPVNVFVYCGDHAWRFAQSRPPGGRIAVPRDADWQTLDFTCLRGLEVMAVARGWTQDELDEFGRRLIHAGALLVVGLLVTRDGPWPRVTPTHYRPQALRRAAA